MTLTDAGGQRFEVIGLSALLRIPIDDPHYRRTFVLACERCRSTCRQEAQCGCCLVYGTRAGGGQPVFYPDDGKHHRPLLALAALQQLCAERGIAPVGASGLAGTTARP